MTAPAPTAVEVAEMRALVVGREVPAVAHRLSEMAERLSRGESLDEEDRALFTRMRHTYGHELAELVDPEG